MNEQLLDGHYLRMDETTVPVLKEPGRAAQTKSYIWARRGMDAEPPVIVFDYGPSRSAEVATRLLGDFSGFLQTDAYSGYAPVVRDNDITWVKCFAHARRRFIDALKALGLNPKKLPDKPPDKARRILKGLSFIRALYAIERRIRATAPPKRYRVRQDESLPVLEKLRLWVDSNLPRVLPSSPLGEALAYLDNHWKELVRYCEDGRLEIDNNLCENAMRPFCLGRRNWLFCDTVNAAKASVKLYSLIQTATAYGREPYLYLRHVFTELPKAETVEDIEALLPWNVRPEMIRDTQPI